MNSKDKKPSAEVELRTLDARPALVTHAQCRIVDIGSSVGPLFGRVAGWAAAHRVALAGPAIAQYSNVESQTGVCELDVGFFVASASPETSTENRTDNRNEEGNAEACYAIQLGGCTAVCATHMGPYETLHETYRAVQTWMAAHDYEPNGNMWEEYFSTPDTPPAQMRTDVFWPVKKKTACKQSELPQHGPTPEDAIPTSGPAHERWRAPGAPPAISSDEPHIDFLDKPRTDG